MRYIDNCMTSKKFFLPALIDEMFEGNRDYLESLINDWPERERVDSIDKHFEETGNIVKPILMKVRGYDKLKVLDGMHRIAWHIFHKIDTIECNIIDLTDKALTKMVKENEQ